MSGENIPADYGWITDGIPNFLEHGFQTGRKVQFRLSNGEEVTDVYQGYGIFGKGVGFTWMEAAPGEMFVEAWRPAK